MNDIITSSYPPFPSGTAVPLPLGCPALRGPRNARGVFGVHFAVPPARNPLSLTKNHPKSDFYLVNSK